MRILTVSGSRADYGLLEWPIKTLRAYPFFDVRVLNLWGAKPEEAFRQTSDAISQDKPDVILILGDRFEIMSAAFAAHLDRVPIAHIAGGDVTEGSYDDAMRDCISRMASIHFVTSSSAMARLTHMGCKNIHLVGSPGIDFIRKADWKQAKPCKFDYVVVSYQPETIDGTNDIYSVLQSLPEKYIYFILPNKDLGSDKIEEAIVKWCSKRQDAKYYDYLPHPEFLNLIYHCDEFIGNSSSMLYEAPELGVKTRMIGKRQKGRTIPWGDGNASERIAKVLRYAAH